MNLCTPCEWQLGPWSLQPTLDLRSHRSRPYVAGKQYESPFLAPGTWREGQDQTNLKEACAGGQLREGSFLPPSLLTHSEVGAPKALQGGQEGIHLVSTHHVSGAVLGTGHGQPCLFPSEGPLPPTNQLSGGPRPEKRLGRHHCTREKEIQSETAGALTLPQSQCPVGKGNGGLAPE